MKRRESREHIFNILFQFNFCTEEERTEKINLYFENNEEIQQEDKGFINEYVKGVMDNKENIDKLVSENSKAWKISRLSYVDLSIMRLSIYEMLYSKEVPVNVSINEAVELAKKYGGEHSSSFINGVLGGVINNKEKQIKE